MVYIILAAILWVGAYVSWFILKEPNGVKSVRSMDDLFE